MFELPCDWTVNRRPVASVAQPPPPPTPTASAINNNSSEPPPASSSSDAPPAITNTTAEEHLAHPLGPRTLLHNIQPPPPLVSESATTTHMGRVKSLVLNQLASSSSVGDGAAGEIKEDADDEIIDTESLLARLPYKRMLQDMFGGSLRGQMHDLPIPYVTRVYEESFMRERMHSSERECAKGNLCECMFIDRSQPFVGVEFLLPGEPMARTPHLCVLCCRATTQQLYYDVMFDKFEFPGTIQRFGNIHSQPGEYALDAMLIAVPTAPVHIMPLPIVSHQRNRYTVYVAGGIKRLRQSRVLFQHTPLRSAEDGQ
jgi:hypothetical protein